MVKTWGAKRKMYQNEVIQDEHPNWFIVKSRTSIRAVRFDRITKSARCSCDYFGASGGKECTHILAVQIYLEGNNV